MDPMLDLVNLIQCERIREAERQRLGRLATCCTPRPSAMSRLIRTFHPATPTRRGAAR